MAKSAYNQYENMSSKEKDNICDNNIEIIQELILQHNERHGSSITLNTSRNNNVTKNDKNGFKRQLTATSQYDDDEGINEDEINPFIHITRSKKKQQKTKEKDEIQGNNDNGINTFDQDATYTTAKHGDRVYVNSSKRTNKKDHMVCINQTSDMNHRAHQSKELKNKKGDYPYTNRSNMNNDSLINQNDNAYERSRYHHDIDNLHAKGIKISQHALNFAVEQHLPPIRIVCSPKVEDHQKGESIVKSLLMHIDKDFRKLNKHFNLPLGFEYWFIDNNGDISCHTKHTELFVYLCEPQNYPPTISSTEISPSRPKHLPAHHTLVLKYVPNDITIDEIKEEMNSSINSIFNLEEMIGSKSHRTRHLRLEVKSTNEYNQLLNRGGITIGGRLIEINEFLAPPRLLICSKCNDPGHTRRNCSFDYDACRRCAQDRSTGDHKECEIKCHRCCQSHLSTDYKCPFLIEYRKSLIEQLKRKPHLLPPNIQLFVPTECREYGALNNKVIGNPMSMNSNNYIDRSNHPNKPQQMAFSLSSNAWPALRNNQPVGGSDMAGVEAIWDELKKKQSEINDLKHELNIKLQQVQSKYDENTKKMREILSIISTQSRCQNENISRCYESLNHYSELLASTFKALQQLIPKFTTPNANNQNDDKSNEILCQISKSINCIQERNSLLITNQQSLNKLIEQHGQLLIQAVNSLSFNNE